jgi:hypothetical protein
MVRTRFDLVGLSRQQTRKKEGTSGGKNGISHLKNPR